MKNKKALTKVQEAPIASFNIETLIGQAIQKGVPVATMKEMLAMRKELKAEWAKEEYDKAMASFQSECPPIQRTKSVKTNSGKVAYSYAPIEVLDAKTKDLRQKYGFSYSSNMSIVENNVKIVLRVTHKAGHSELTEMTVPLGNKTDIMSNSQVTVAAATFAKRHAFINAFGITMVDEDDETLLKKGEEEPVALPENVVEGVRKAETHEELIKFCKEAKETLKPELHNALRNLYTDRKRELEEVDPDEAEKGIEEQRKKETQNG